MLQSANNNAQNNCEVITQGKSSFHPLHFFAEGQRVSRCVALVQLGNGSGTGFLLPGNWLLTNHHVIPNESAAKNAIVMFNYERGADGFYTAVAQYKLDPAAGFHCSPFNGGDDWAVIKIKGDANLKFGAIRLDAASTAALGDALHIIQHPAGQHKQIAMFEQSVIEVSARRLRYLTDTLPGSSGSPVFNNQWQVVALHHSGAESWNKERGGSVPCNEGITIAAILEGLQAAGVWPHESADARLDISADTGPMAVDNPWYVHRKADSDALKHFRKRGITVALKGGAESGKSSLAARLQAAMVGDSWRNVNIDIGHDFAEADFNNGYAFLLRLAQKIVEQVAASKVALKAFEFDGTPSAFKAFLHSLLLELSDNQLLITLDRIDAIAGQPCCAEVLSGLRVVHNAQSQLGAKHRVKLLLIHTIQPQQTEAMGSVFDVARVVEVADFTEAELADLVALYRLQPVDVGKLHAFLGGHPGLSRMALDAMAEDGLSLDDLQQAAMHDGGIFRQHLDRVRKRFKATPDPDKLALAFIGLVNGDALTSEDSFEALLALGLVRGSYRGDATLRSSLYAEYLGKRLR